MPAMPSHRQQEQTAEQMDIVLIVMNEIENGGDPQHGDDAENRVGAGGAEPRGETDQEALLQGAADAHQPDRPDGRRDHETQDQAAIINAEMF